jgi:hypothetical protein
MAGPSEFCLITPDPNSAPDAGADAAGAGVLAGARDRPRIPERRPPPEEPPLSTLVVGGVSTLTLLMSGLASIGPL